jgi:hypothetical protein
MSKIAKKERSELEVRFLEQVEKFKETLGYQSMMELVSKRWGKADPFRSRMVGSVRYDGEFCEARGEPIFENQQYNHDSEGIYWHEICPREINTRL